MRIGSVSGWIVDALRCTGQRAAPKAPLNAQVARPAQHRLPGVHQSQAVRKPAMDGVRQAHTVLLLGLII